MTADDERAAALPTRASLDGTRRPGISSVRSTTPARSATVWQDGKKAQHSKWRHTVGILLLLVTVVLWTASNFLASNIFADDTYSKPFFVTYTNTAFFIIPLIPILASKHHYEPSQFSIAALRSFAFGWRQNQDKQVYQPVNTTLDDNERDEDALLKPNEEDTAAARTEAAQDASPLAPLTIPETARLSLEFCLMWFTANYFQAACLEYTTVASSTVLTSTSSIWTLLIGSLAGVEKFTVRKLIGTLASLAGIILISMVDISGENDENRGSFPHKEAWEVGVGDALAFVSAVMYGFYAVLMKKRIGDETRTNMPLFFGFVGLFNVLLLWPAFIILHYTGIELFRFPRTSKTSLIIIANSMSSLVSDICWAYAMLLTSPLVVTVGLSLTIPLSLVGQMVLDAQYSSVWYWVGAGVVFLSFIFINHEETREEDLQAAHDDEEAEAEGLMVAVPPEGGAASHSRA